MNLEQRTERREPMALPLRLRGGLTTTTRNISPSGMYLQIAGTHSLAGHMLFEMDLAEARLRFTAEGEVVRIEHRNGWTGVAVRLDSRRLVPILSDPRR